MTMGVGGAVMSEFRMGLPEMHPEKLPDKVGASGADGRDRRRSDLQKKGTRQKARWRRVDTCTLAP